MSTLALPISKGRERTPGLGTFAGVYLPSLLTIFGVIMFLRLGYVVGSVGLIPALVIVLLSSSITFLTSLSIATSSTNIAMKGGGAYFLISRAFGKEIGASVGLPLYLAQAIGIAFYITGFVETLSPFIPQVPPQILGLSTLAVLTVLAYTSASVAMKAQGLILIAVVASMISFFWGHEVRAESVELIPSVPLSFWAAFALFFPAVTGIEAGVSMSGDLRNPAKSLVRGVVLAVLTGMVVYLLMCWRLDMLAPREVLRGDPSVVRHMARWGWLITLGIWGATLSSGLGALLGAPRTLQALAQDGVMPRLLAKGFGPTKEPRVATLFTFLISGICIYFGRIDAIAPVLAMFFLMSYGMLNLGAALEGLMQNPSWRPTFKVRPVICLVGAAMCLMAMLMINPGATFLALLLVVIVYALAARSSATAGWDDIRQGVLFFLSRLALYRLAEEKRISSRSWRPNFLVFTNGYKASPRLLKFTSAITRDKGLLILSSIFDKVGDSFSLDAARMRIRTMCSKKKVQALVYVSEESNRVAAMERSIDGCGLGALFPNTVVLGDVADKNNREETTQVILHAHERQRNALVIVGDAEENFIESSADGDDPSRIDVWWDDKNKANSMLMLVLAHMHQCSKDGVSIHLKCHVPTESAREQRQAFFLEFLERTRFRVSTDVYVEDDEEDIGRLRSHFSRDANLVFCGLRMPTVSETCETYTTYYREVIKQHRRIQNLVLVLAGDGMDLQALFS